MRFLYVIASYVLFWVLFPFLLLHRKTKHGLRERLGFYAPGSVAEGGHPRIWLHGASAGDLLALSPMIGELRRKFPAARIFLSTTTNTGQMMAKQRLASQVDGVFYWPYDLAGATRRAVRAIRPDLLVLEYTEIWPNLIRAAKRAGVPVALTNGRFSPDKLGRYRALFGFVGNPLRDISLFLMREQDEADRAIELGAPEARVFATGNTKFDSLAAPERESDDGSLARALALPADARLWIAGSTHEGEEEAIFSVYRELRERFPALRLMIAPRYIDRVPRVVALAQEAGLECRLRSAPQAKSGAPVIVLDTMGELSRAYGLATVVFIGGSFTRRGGQNILEPAAQGKPVLFGPHMENFRDSVQVLMGRGGLQVRDAEHLKNVLGELLSRPETIVSLGELARAAVRQISGASARNVERMAAVLKGGVRT